MSQAEELLNSLAEVDEGDYEEDDTPYFVIDPTTRTITPPAGFTNLGVESDEKAKTIHFKSPRRVSDTVDLAALNLYINYRNANKQEDAHIADVTEVTDEYIYFSWELKRKVTRYKGTVDFIVCAMRTKSDGTISKEWNTTLCKGNVLEGLEVDNPEVEEETVDLVDQLVSIVKTNMAEVEETTSRVLVEIEDARVGALQDVDITRKDAVNVVEGARDESVAAVDAVKESVLAYIGTGVDKTLSKENLAADAKATGDAVKSVAIIPNVTGSIITTTDSAETGLAGLKIYGKSEQFSTTGKNLLNGRLWETEKTQYGMTIKYLPDEDCFIINGTVTAGYNMYQINFATPMTVGESYTLKSEVISGSVSGDGYKVFFLGASDDETTVANWESVNIFESNSRTVTASKNYVTAMWFYFTKGVTCTNLKVKLMFSKGTDDTYEPYTGGEASPNPNYPQEITSVGDSGSVEAKVHGYQLFDASMISSITNNGVTITNNGDGSFTITGTATTAFSTSAIYTHEETLSLLKTGSITLSNDGVYGYPHAYMVLIGTDGNYFEVNTGSSKYTTNTVTQEMLDDESLIMKIGIYNTTSSSTITKLKPMLYQDGDGTWESYKPLQSATFTAPNGLRGIPVTSNGNYTDENGQQWICDEVDLERGVYVQNVGEWKYTGGDLPTISTASYYASSSRDHNNIYWNFNIKGVQPKDLYHDVISTHFRNSRTVYSYSNAVMISPTVLNYIYFSHKASDWGFAYGDGATLADYRTAITNWMQSTFSEDNPLIVNYPLATPIETPLTDEEIAAYKALHMYKPNTTIYNSEGADMSVDYIADPEIYIEQNYVAKDAFEALEARVEALEG